MHDIYVLVRRLMLCARGMLTEGRMDKAGRPVSDWKLQPRERMVDEIGGCLVVFGIFSSLEKW